MQRCDPAENFGASTIISSNELRLDEFPHMTLLDADKYVNAVGEDACELFEAIEESFGVELGDYHALGGIRVSELAEKICTLTTYPAQDGCLSAIAFYRLRRAFGTLFNVPRISIRPTTPVGQLLPPKSRATQWRVLENHLGLALPNLMYPLWLFLLCLISPAVLLIFASEFLGLRISAFVILLDYVVLTVLEIRALDFVSFERAQRTFPLGCGTMGGLAKTILARNYAVFAMQYGSSLERGVLPTLRQLIAINTSIPVEKILPETRIPSDLNIY